MSDSNKLLVSATGAVTSAAAIQGLSLTDGSATISGGSLTGATNVTAAGTVSGNVVASAAPDHSWYDCHRSYTYRWCILC